MRLIRLLVVVTGSWAFLSCGGNGGGADGGMDGQVFGPHAVITATVNRGEVPLDVTFDGSSSSSSEGSITGYLWDFGDGTTATTVSVNRTFSKAGSYSVKLTVTDNQGLLDSTATMVFASDPAILPPDPTEVAPELDSSKATDFYEATKFLYTGDNPIQSGVEKDTIQPKLVSVLRGKVFDPVGNALPGVRIAVLNHPEYGTTLSRKDGGYDLAVNSGQTLVVSFQLLGYFQLQRQIRPPSLDYGWLPEVVLKEMDPEVTVMGSPKSLRAARGSKVSDPDGVRQASILIFANTKAEMVLPDGSTRQMDGLSLRATEYSIGESGEKAMPAMLPETTGYTYCVEYSVDEAIAAGAEDVRFDKPLIHYQENFLGFPVGGIVPVGYYERKLGKWVPSKNGRVIQLVGEAGGVAQIDCDGDGEADDADSLSQLGVATEELQELSRLYDTGTSLWRVPMEHFTSWDCNWPYGPPADAAPPELPWLNPPDDDPCDPPCPIVEFQTQNLGETIPVVGTPFSLNYRSNRVEGNLAAHSLAVPLSGNSLPASLKSIVLEVNVAGQKYTENFDPSLNQSHSFVWDGKDAYGRKIQGAADARIRVGYTYPAIYMEPEDVEEAFGRLGDTPISGGANRTDITLWQEWTRKLGTWNSLGQGLGGWSLSVHHAYDPKAGILYLGDGNRRFVGASGEVISTVAGTGIQGYSGDGGPAVAAELDFASCVAAGNDGSFYIAEGQLHRIRRVGPDGIIDTIAGNGNQGSAGDGGQALDAELGLIWGMEFGADGSLYLADATENRVRRIGPDGIISTVAGTGVPGFSGDQGKAVAAKLGAPQDVALGQVGELYIADTANMRIRRVDPDGVITTFAGTGEDSYFSGEGGPASDATLVPHTLSSAPDGSLLVADSFNSRVYRIGVDGIIATVAGTGQSGDWGDFGPATDAAVEPWDVVGASDGSIYIADPDYYRVRRVAPDGIIFPFAGNGEQGYSGDGGPATEAQFIFPISVALTAEGSLLIADAASIRKVGQPFGGLGLGQKVFASANGQELYVFDGEGRHFRTLDALSGQPIYEFSYDQGLLATIFDNNGLITTVERDSEGKPQAIVSPQGERTGFILDGQGYLASVENPQGEIHQMAYQDNGLMTSFQVPRGSAYEFGYDELGRLTEFTDPGNQQASTLTRTQSEGGVSVAHKTPTGLTTTYQVQADDSGETTRTRVDPDGAETVFRITKEGGRELTHPDGTSVVMETQPDPRFGGQAAFVKTITETNPSGLQSLVAFTRSVELSDPADLLSLRKMTEQMDINGRIYQTVYDAGLRSFTKLTPEGRETTVALDTKGRVSSIAMAAGLDPIGYAYDLNGRVTKMTQGAQSWSYAYDAQGRVQTRTNAAGEQTSYSYDQANRLVEMISPSLRAISFGFDSDGNRTQVILPSGAVHELRYSPVDLFSGYLPPQGQAFVKSYNPDRSPTLWALPSGRSIQHSYQYGRLVEVAYPEAVVSFSYASGSSCCGSREQLDSLSRTPLGDGLEQAVAFVYDGKLITEMIFAGAASGGYLYAYDENFLLTEATFSQTGRVTAMSWDSDAQLVTIGPFVYERQAPGSMVSAISDGVMNLQLGYDSAGRLAQKILSVNSAILYRLQLAYDASGRIQQKVENLQGTGHTYDYTYDPDGWLLQVKRDSVVVESYAFDDNGNRTTPSASYDAQDRLIQLGGTSYGFDPDGFLQTRGSDSFGYSARGELVQATMGGQTVSYDYDGFGRKVAVHDPSGDQAFLYGNPGAPFLVTASLDPSGDWTEYFYDELGQLFAFYRASEWYYVGSDQVGTPLLVADATGAVVKGRSHDSFGRLLADSAPAFVLPIGFAGGLADATTQWVRFGFRDYDPQEGRWTARDPILFAGRQANLYAYAGNDPVGQRDPTGLWCVGGGIGIGGYVGGRLCCTWDGCSACVEAGLGVGGGASLDPMGGLDPTGIGSEASVSASIGVVSGNITAKLNECGGKIGAGVEVGTGEGVGVSAKWTTTFCGSL